MHIAVISHHRLPVKGYGGPQRVVVALVRGLVELGHRVTVIATPGSKLPTAPVLEVAPRDHAGNKVAGFVPRDADIAHAHYPISTWPLPLPLVQTLHGNGKAGKPLPPNTVFLSRDHAARHGGTSFVHNGLVSTEFTFRRRKEAWSLFLGRLHSAKGYHWAIEAAKRTGRRLILAGGWRPSFSNEIKYVGEVDDKQKAVLLARARCLWTPALWDEPFGLASIEALFSGTPVIGTRRGALPEIITPDVGALGDTLEELVEASQQIHTRDPECCRARAERLFSHTAMARRYLLVYESLLTSGTLPACPPAIES
ncbi:MAG TPA: glycosyltransferase [Gemmatimonadales bacterium]|nr:glycosyltransferase [Gemmatimonadales bacterium]